MGESIDQGTVVKTAEKYQDSLELRSHRLK